MDLFRVLRCKLNGLPETPRRSLGIRAPLLRRTARPVADDVGNEDRGKPSLDTLLGHWLLPDTRLGWMSLCPRRLGLSRPNVTCGSGPALHDRGSVRPLWSDLGHKPRGPKSPLLAKSGRSAHREPCLLNPQHRTFGRANAPTRETPVQAAGPASHVVADAHDTAAVVVANRDYGLVNPSRQTGMNGHAFDRFSIVLPFSAVGRTHLGNLGLDEDRSPQIKRPLRSLQGEKS